MKIRGSFTRTYCISRDEQSGGSENHSNLKMGLEAWGIPHR